MPHPESARWINSISRNLPVYQIFAANTDVGKTICSTALTKSALALNRQAFYLKPIQTGFPRDSDARHVKMFCSGAETATLYTYNEPASPHLTAIWENKPISDSQLLESVQKFLNDVSAQTASRSPFVIVETAGGVNSPSTSGNLQSDVYRPLRLPIVLIGDSALGGISTTLSSYEALVMRGYTVSSVLMFDNKQYKNHDIIARNVDAPVDLLAIPPEKEKEHLHDATNMMVYYETAAQRLGPMVSRLIDEHDKRIQELEGMAERGKRSIWWPFTQHGLVRETTVIDSAYGDYYTTLKQPSSAVSVAGTPSAASVQLFDACASWWTQALGHGNPKLALAAAHAAGRYGHLIFPEVVHRPALELAEKLLKQLGDSWATRVFYTDNGSTGMEVALKMAFKTFEKRQAKLLGEDPAAAPTNKALEVIGIKGAYHGDTIGAMDAADQSVFNDKVNWYKGRGFWFDPPTVVLKNGEYLVRLPECIKNAGTPEIAADLVLPTRDNVFSTLRDGSALARLYREHISARLASAIESGHQFGALTLEPVLLGAGGMQWIDPLFQRVLVESVRALPKTHRHAAVPVVFDEVFTGLYRLGYPSAARELLQTQPDIAVYAKSLTGGVTPLCVNLTSEEVYLSFLGDEKLEALLHGHSYTAYPVGCELGTRSLDLLEDLYKRGAIRDTWSEKECLAISRLPNVDGVVSLGTVLAVELAAEDGKGYGSCSAQAIVESLRTEHNVYARPLGNVVYFMSSHVTPQQDANRVIETVRALIQSPPIGDPSPRRSTQEAARLP
ncbi:pyridoxal phosphate-dependent transferase [Polychytrium aggregatum]|uniref:pyridoxal phosphate-dependent transferase n=1 Tax=Polychytrium aggregatum TaxID=110093 RepID=UPI0022FE7DD2|nr:pyridoxal phosphate-dependent transferase [Polychytrium aggregatum]KAI9203841.1 pyridoxal phosphate-dependent transferase [Polychytrium aggregatum]